MSGLFESREEGLTSPWLWRRAVWRRCLTVGALLSVPIAAAIKIVCENIQTLHPISVMMGSGKTYQREFLKANKANPD